MYLAARLAVLPACPMYLDHTAPGATIRVAILDRHAAIRAGLEAILRETADLVAVGVAEDRAALWPLLDRTDPDVVLIGDVRAGEALRLCLQVRNRSLRTRVVVYTPDAGLQTAVPGAFAGAHAVVDAAAGVTDLLHALRSPHPRRAPLTPALRRHAAKRLSHQDRAILAMTLAGTPAHELGATVGLSRAELAARRAAILAALTRPLDHEVVRDPHPLGLLM